jgi:hypothetical protein
MIVVAIRRRELDYVNRRLVNQRHRKRMLVNSKKNFNLTRQAIILINGDFFISKQIAFFACCVKRIYSLGFVVDTQGEDTHVDYQITITFRSTEED